MTSLTSARLVVRLVSVFDMTLSQKNQSFFQKHHKLLAALLAVALPYAGFNGYQDVKKSMAAPGTQTVTVNVESVPESMTHTDRVRSDGEIKAIVKAALATQQVKHLCHDHGICE